MTLYKVIHDGDHGSDDFITTLMLLSQPDKIDLKAVTVCHGNTNVRQAAENACKALGLGKRQDVPVYIGAEKPIASAPKEGDNAFDEDGLSGVKIQRDHPGPSQKPAVLAINEICENAHEGIYLLATGPMTNIAKFIKEASLKAINNIIEIIAMGGGFDPDGNITSYAEFNFYMDPDAANFVLNSGIPIVLHTLHSDHQLCFDPDRQSEMNERLPDEWSNIIIPMMRSAEKFDIPQFGSSGSFIHDQHTAIYLQKPELYRTFSATAKVLTEDNSDTPGKLLITKQRKNSPLKIVQQLDNPHLVFKKIIDDLVNLAESTEQTESQ